MFIPILNKLSQSDRVIAVSSFGLQGWPEEEYWISYIGAQLSATEKGAIVKRIFCPVKTNIFLKTRPIAPIHDATKKMIGYLVEDETKVSDAIPSNLKIIFKRGFMLINSKTTGDRMAVFDHFDNLGYRTHISFNEDMLIDIEDTFDKIIKNLPQIQIKHNCD